MISVLSGKIILKSSTEVVIDCGGVGYLASISLNTSSHIPDRNENVTLFTHLIPKEDSLNLFGFWNETEREAFKMLISISGIGAKTALTILSSITLEELQEYVISANIFSLSKLPGVGKKTAERIVLELKDKMLKFGDVRTGTDTHLHRIREEALSALLTLGYNRQNAEKAVRKALEDTSSGEVTPEGIIRMALKYAMQ